MLTIIRQLIISTLLSVVLIPVFGLGIGGCRPSEPWTSNNPEFALRAFLQALQNGDGETVSAFLSTESQDLLDQVQAETAATLGPDGAPGDPLAGLYRVWTPSALEIERLETTQQTDSSATVIIHSVYDTQQNVHMTRSQDRWTIDLTNDLMSTVSQPPGDDSQGR